MQSVDRKEVTLSSNKGKTFKHTKTKEAFVQRAHAKHDNKYDYSKVDFPDRGYSQATGKKLPDYDANRPVVIVCPDHGPYTQRPRKHLEGSGCRKCGSEATAKALLGRPSTIIHQSRYYDGRLEVPRVLQEKLQQQLDAHRQQRSQCRTHVFTIDSPTHGIIEVLIDKKDWARVSAYTWSASKCHAGRDGERQFYVTTRIPRPDLPRYTYTHPRTGKTRTYLRVQGLQIARLIMSCPDGMVVDHINGNTLDNRRHNLRICTVTENNQNTRKKTNTSSRFKGVNRNKNKKYNCWSAYLRMGGKTVNLGSYATEEDAARAYDIVHLTKSGIYAKTNFPVESYLTTGEKKPE